MGKPEFKQCLLIVTYNNKNSNGILLFIIYVKFYVKINYKYFNGVFFYRYFISTDKIIMISLHNVRINNLIFRYVKNDSQLHTEALERVTLILFCSRKESSKKFIAL
jgi:hypothetical protein